MGQPSIRTPSLLLRPFQPADAPLVQRLAGAAQVADTTLQVPHPYLDGMAEGWISGHASAWVRAELAIFAIVTLDGDLRGAISLTLAMEHQRAQLGYWVGVPFWGRGIATEAVTGILAFGFGTLDLHRIEATHLIRNPASGRVMQKAGMRYEGTLRDRYIKGGRFEDVALYAVLKPEWNAGPERHQD